MNPHFKMDVTTAVFRHRTCFPKRFRRGACIEYGTCSVSTSYNSLWRLWNVGTFIIILSFYLLFQFQMYNILTLKHYF